jgi:nucleoid-associated protein YgaU
MTRENKLALVVGFGLILFVGILITDHLAADTRSHEPLPAARIPDAPAISLLGRDQTPLEQERAPVREVNRVQPVTEIVLDPTGDTTSTPARPMRAVEPGATRTITEGALAGRGMATPPPPAERVHVVANKETLSGIAKTYYGNAGLWRRIANANPRVNPNILRPGTRLTIPAEDPKSSRPAATREVDPASPAPVPRRSYTVRSGDTLTGIATSELGAERRWQEIKKLNGLPGDLVFPGQTLVLPSR